MFNLSGGHPAWNKTEEKFQIETISLIAKRAGLELLSLEARVGFEPTNGGFADLSLGPLGYRAESLSIANLLSSSDRADSKLSKHPYFFSATADIFASRKKRADSSGGVGLM